MSKVCVFLADGFEEIEGLTVVDLLRRAGIEVDTVSVMGRLEINGSHKIRLFADKVYEEEKFDDVDLLVLPGGLPGTTHLGEHEELGKLLVSFAESGKYVSAICAAPSVLGGLGLLKGRKATCHPGWEEKLIGAEPCTDTVVRDGNVITSRGLGTAIDFGLKLIEILAGEEAVAKVRKGIVY